MKRKPQSDLDTVLVILPEVDRSGHYRPMGSPGDLTTSRQLEYGWHWELITFNTWKDLSPFRVVSNWTYMSQEKALASGKAAAKLLGIKVQKINVAQPFSKEAVEHDKKSAAWHDGTRVDGKPVGGRHR